LRAYSLDFWAMPIIFLVTAKKAASRRLGFYSTAFQQNQISELFRMQTVRDTDPEEEEFSSITPSDAMEYDRFFFQKHIQVRTDKPQEQGWIRFEDMWFKITFSVGSKRSKNWQIAFLRLLQNLPPISATRNGLKDVKISLCFQQKCVRKLDGVEFPECPRFCFGICASASMSHNNGKPIPSEIIGLFSGRSKQAAHSMYLKAKKLLAARLRQDPTIKAWLKSGEE